MRLSAVVRLATLLAACTSSHPTVKRAGQHALYGDTWSDTASRAHVLFEPGTAQTDDGCDGQRRQLTVHGSRLHLGAQIGRGYICSGLAAPLAEAEKRELTAENRFDRVLASSPTWSITGKTLILTAPNGVSITLTKI